MNGAYLPAITAAALIAGSLTMPLLSAVAADKRIATIEVAIRPVASRRPGLSQAVVYIFSKTVVVDLRLHSYSDSPIFLTEQGDDWNYVIELVGPDGHEVDATDYKKCVLFSPRSAYWNSSVTLQPFATRPGKLELNQLFKLDQIGVYRLVVGRRVLLLTRDGKHQQGSQMLWSEPAFFVITGPQMDSSPGSHCPI